jgi:cytidylate kinase
MTIRRGQNKENITRWTMTTGLVYRIISYVSIMSKKKDCSEQQLQKVLVEHDFNNNERFIPSFHLPRCGSNNVVKDHIMDNTKW